MYKPIDESRGRNISNFVDEFKIQWDKTYGLSVIWPISKIDAKLCIYVAEIKWFGVQSKFKRM